MMHPVVNITFSILCELLMDSKLFYDSLKDQSFTKEASAFLEDLTKESGIMEKATSFVMANKKPIIGALIGGATLGAGASHFSKPGKSGKSVMQDEADDAYETSQLKQKAQLDRTGKNTAKVDFSAATHKQAKDTADLFAKHPKAAALALATIGAKAGWNLAQQAAKRGLI
jgi:hypothetical protein